MVTCFNCRKDNHFILFYPELKDISDIKEIEEEEEEEEEEEKISNKLGKEEL